MGVLITEQGREILLEAQANKKIKKINNQGIEEEKTCSFQDIADEVEVNVRTVQRFLGREKAVRRITAIKIIKVLNVDPLEIELIEKKDNLEDYIEPPALEEQCYKEIQKPGSLLRIKAPQGFGKTELLTRILNHAESIGYQKVYLSFAQANQETFSNISSLLVWLCKGVTEKLQLSNRIPQKSKEIRFTIDCKNYFEQYVLNQLNSPLVLGLDAVDRIFPYPIAGEFLGMLRSWHEEAKTYPIWEKLRVVIVHSTEVYIPINANQSPFNVGIEVELPEFTLKQIQDLAKGRGLNWNVPEVNQLMNKVGGHPKLVNLAIDKVLFQSITINQLLTKPDQVQRIYHDRLQEMWENLQQYPNLVDAMRKIVNESETVQLEEEIKFKLYSLGLVKLDNGIKPRFPLYQQYFSHRFENE